MNKTLLLVFVILFNIFPIFAALRKNFLSRNKALKTIFIVLYLILFMPLIQFTSDIQALKQEHVIIFAIITVVNLALLVWNLGALFKYSFVDILFGKRKIVPSDLIVTFLSYITMGVSYGFLYAIISAVSEGKAFRGISETKFTLGYYFEHIYYSFVTLTTAGYGDITPISTVAKIATVIEILCGIMLINIILGITLSSGLAHVKVVEVYEEEENKENKEKETKEEIKDKDKSKGSN